MGGNSLLLVVLAVLYLAGALRGPPLSIRTGARTRGRLACGGGGGSSDDGEGRITETVPQLQGGKQRIDVYLSSILKTRSRSFLGDLCDKGGVTVNDKPVTKSYKVATGDVISLQIQEREVSRVTPENIPLDVLYEDDDIIAINKPQGMVVHPAPGSPNATFVNALLYHLGPSATRLLDEVGAASLASPEVQVLNDESEDLLDAGDVDLPETPEAAKASPASLRPGVVHRLDKGTSGVLLAGKHPQAVAKVSFRGHSTQVLCFQLTMHSPHAFSHHAAYGAVCC